MSTSTKINSKRRSGGDHSAHGGGISHASSLSKRQKVTKDSLLKGSVVEEVDALSSILPLRLAALGGYLPLKDAGRFLLRVSKDMTASIFEERVSLDGTVAAAAADDGGPGDANDATAGRKGVTNDDSQAPDAEKDTVSLRQAVARNEAWKYLCEQKWRNPSTLDHLVSVIGRSDSDDDEMATDWERLFRKFLRTPRKPAVKASVEDYSFVFSLMKGRESGSDSTAPLSTHVLNGDRASEFLRTGEETGWLQLSSPVFLGNFANVEEFREMWSEEAWEMVSTMHALRHSDGKSCELNYQHGFSNFFDDASSLGNVIRVSYDGGGVITVGDLERIIAIRDPRVEDDTGFCINQDLQITAFKKCDGSSDYQITHINFNVTLFIGGSGYNFSERLHEMKPGVTVADFLARLDVDWK